MARFKHSYPALKQQSWSDRRSSERPRRGVGITAVAVGLVIVMVMVVGASNAAEAPVALGTAESFSVLGGTGVTNTGPTVLTGDLGTCPTPAITGFTGPPQGTSMGTIHANDAVACGAQADLVIAYDDAAGRAPNVTYPGPTDLVGSTLTPGVYMSPTEFSNSGTFTLDAQGDPNAVWVFQAGSTLITSVNSRIVMLNGALPCNVFWQVGSSATLGVGSTFVGTILALTSIAANTNAIIDGRLLARNGAVTLDSNVVTTSACAITTTTEAPTTSSTTGGASTTTGVGTTTTVGGVDGGTTTGVGGSGATTTVVGVTGGATTTAGGTGATTSTLSPGTVGVTTTVPSAGRVPGGPGTPPGAPPLPRTGSSAQGKALAAALVLIVAGALLVAGNPFRRRNRSQPAGTGGFRP